MAAGPASRLGSTEPGDKTGPRPSPALALAHTLFIEDSNVVALPPMAGQFVEVGALPSALQSWSWRAGGAAAALDGT